MHLGSGEGTVGKGYPLVNMAIDRWFAQKKWWFHIVKLVYQRANVEERVLSVFCTILSIDQIWKHVWCHCVIVIVFWKTPNSQCFWAVCPTQSSNQIKPSASLVPQKCTSENWVLNQQKPLIHHLNTPFVLHNLWQANMSMENQLFLQGKLTNYFYGYVE